MKVCGSDVWLAGDSGLLAKFDGAQVFNARGSFSSSLRALACTDANDLWAAGNYTIAHFDGTSWSPVDTGINDQAWRAISVSSDEVWVTGETPYLVHGDRVAGTWDAVSEPAGLRLHGGDGPWPSG